MGHRNFILFLLLFLVLSPLASGIDDIEPEIYKGFKTSHAEDSDGAQKETPKERSQSKDGFRHAWDQAFQSASSAQEAFRKLQKILRNEEQEAKLDELSQLLEGIDRKDNTPSKEFFKNLLSALPESKLSAPLSALLRAKLREYDELERDHHDKGRTRREEKVEDRDAILAAQANRVELARRLRDKFSLTEAEAKKISSLMQVQANEQMARLLARSFDSNELIQLQKHFSGNHSLTEEENHFRSRLEDKIGDAILEQKKSLTQSAVPETIPRGTFLPEGTNGHFLISQFAVEREETSKVARTILEEGGNITVIGNASTREPFDKFVSGLSPELRKKITFVATEENPGLWATDYHGLPVKETLTGKKSLLDPKYHYGGLDDLIPGKVEGKLSGLPTTKFDHFLEGGNILNVPGKDGKPVIIVSDTFQIKNAKRNGTPPEESISSLRTQLADQATLVVVPGQDDVTGHVDMFLKPTSNGKVYISDYSPYLSQMADGKGEAERAQSRLDEAYRLLAPYVDLEKVPQIPMYLNHSFTKLNNISFMGNGKKVYLIPDYPEHPLNDAVNADMKDILTQEEEAPKIRLLDSSKLINLSGSFHCVFPQVCYPFQK